MKTYKLIARKEVVLDIASGKQKTEEREWVEYYKTRFKDLETPCILRLRGGYNKEALFVEVIAESYEIRNYSMSRFDKLIDWIFRIKDEYIVFKLGKVIQTNVLTKDSSS
jgi:hypothetical protein